MRNPVVLAPIVIKPRLDQLNAFPEEVENRDDVLTTLAIKDLDSKHHSATRRGCRRFKLEIGDHRCIGPILYRFRVVRPFEAGEHRHESHRPHLHRKRHSRTSHEAASSRRQSLTLAYHIGGPLRQTRNKVLTCPPYPPPPPRQTPPSRYGSPPAP